MRVLGVFDSSITGITSLPESGESWRIRARFSCLVCRFFVVGHLLPVFRSTSFYVPGGQSRERTSWKVQKFPQQSSRVASILLEWFWSRGVPGTSSCTTQKPSRPVFPKYIFPCPISSPKKIRRSHLWRKILPRFFLSNLGRFISSSSRSSERYLDSINSVPWFFCVVLIFCCGQLQSIDD